MILTIDVLAELENEHKKIRNTMLDIGESFEKGNLLSGMKLLGSINGLVGAHMKFEDDILYPMLRRFVW